MNNNDIVQQIAPGVWAIDNEGGSSFYLVEGSERAVLIDTGIAKRPVMPLVRSLTQKPVALIITHAHTDHMYHENEFEEAYMHSADIKAWRWPLGPAMRLSAKSMFKVEHRRFDAKRCAPLSDNSVIDLGGVTLKIMHAPGHTPGSILIYCEEHKLLFTSDAFGSGAGAWVWLPGCLSMSKYRDSLNALLPRLEQLGACTYLAGHRAQATGENTVDLQLVRDMAILCDDVLKGKAHPKAEYKKGLLKLYLYAYGKASFVQAKRKIK